MQSTPRPAWGYMAIALLLLIDGVLLAIAESSILLPLPFLMAAYLYFSPTTNNLGRQLIGAATLALMALSVILGLSELTTGLGGPVLQLITGMVIIGSSMAVAALVLSMFFIPRALGKDTQEKP